MQKRKRVALVANKNKPAACQRAAETAAWLAERAEVVGVIADAESDLAALRPDLVVVFGGDGTVLNAAARLGECEAPMLTVHLGRLGYLAEVQPADLRPALERALAGHFRLSRRMRLVAVIKREGDEVWRGIAINEFALLTGQPGRAAHFEVLVDDRPLTRFAADGVIVATATGSTAYSLSAGGPILNPELRAMLLVPICPHHLANRPLVLGDGETLRVRHLEDTSVPLAADGHRVRPIARNESILIRPAAKDLCLIVAEASGRYDILRQKLGWGG